MSREWSLFEADWPSLLQAQPPYTTGRPRAPRPPAAAPTGLATAAGRCMPADPYSLFYQDENLCYPTHFPYQHPSPHDSMALLSPESSYHQLYSPLHQQFQMQMPPQQMTLGEVVAAATVVVAPPKL